MTTTDLLAFGPRISANVRHRRLLTFLLVAMTCTLPAELVHGQAGGGNAGTNIPVLVVIEDEDLASIKRSSDMFNRLIAELRTAMQFHGFQMFDEESLFADQGYGVIPDRRSKTALITDIKSLTLSDEARHQIRVWVLLRVRAAAVDTQAGMTRRVHVRMDGEIYDAQSNYFLDSYDQTKWTATTPTCVKTKLCIEEHVGTVARDLATSLGNILATKLERYSPNTDVSGEAGSAPRHAMATIYTFKFRYFDLMERLTIVDVMANDFPGAMSVERVTSRARVTTYSYQTTATAAKLEDWLYKQLHIYMGFNEGEIAIESDRGNFTITKIVSTPNRPRSEDETSRFS